MKYLTGYKKNGYDFVLAERKGDVMRAKGFNGTTFNNEVFHVQSHDGRTIQGKEFPPAEFAPSNNEWGKKGWTFLTEEAAKQHFEKLTQ